MIGGRSFVPLRYGISIAMSRRSCPSGFDTVNVNDCPVLKRGIDGGSYGVPSTDNRISPAPMPAT